MFPCIEGGIDAWYYITLYPTFFLGGGFKCNGWYSTIPSIYTCNLLQFNWEGGEEGLCDLKFYVHPLVHSVGGCHPTTGRPFIPTPHSHLPNGGLCPLECATQPMWSWSSMKSVEKGSHHQSIGYFPPTHDQKKNNNNKYIYTHILKL